MTKKQTIESYFEAFGNLDSLKMNSYYTDDIILESLSVGVKKGDEARYYWQFLCNRIKNHKIEIIEISINEDIAIVKWRSSSFLTLVGKKVHLTHVSEFIFEGDLICKHKSEYDLKELIEQLFGSLIGKMGDTNFLKKIVKGQTNKLLENYIKENELVKNKLTQNNF